MVINSGRDPRYTDALVRVEDPLRTRSEEAGNVVSLDDHLRDSLRRDERWYGAVCHIIYIYISMILVRGFG